MKRAIIFTSATEHLAKSLKRKLKNAIFIFLEKNKEGKRFFPDGEIYARISMADNLKSKRVIVLHSGAPRPNDGLVELELVLQILKDRKIRPEIFFTYFPYGQQDKIFQPGEGNVAESLVKKLINYYRVKKIYAIDPHFGRMPWLKKYPFVGISAVPLLKQKAEKDFGPDILFLSLDRGGKRRTGLAGLNKSRINSFEVKLAVPKTSFRRKTVAAVDDILETGGTLTKFYDFAKKDRAQKIIALITHGPLDEGIQKIKNKFSRLYLTNTINTQHVNVDIADLIVSIIN